MKKAFMNWSGGKDSSLALHHILKSNSFSIDYLLTNLSAEHNRISMHGVSFDLLQLQAESLKIPLETLKIVKDAAMEDYNRLVSNKMSFFTQQQIQDCVFGDIFLEDLKVYREKQLKTVGITPHFPLWKRPTSDIIQEFFDLGFKAKVVSINAKLLDKSFAGRELDQSFIDDLPEGVDVCGENGEFHSFVYDGPIFNRPIPVTVGEIVKKEYKSTENKDWDSAFWFADLT
jgi:uncharacterized protein (TIGR00290 family)